MSIITQKGFDYKFDNNACQKCGGKCCIGETGNIFVNSLEIRQISDFLDLSVLDFIFLYLKRVDNQYSIKEIIIEDSYNCIFFDDERRKCSIYPVRPTQCRSFPFWKFYKNKPVEIKKICPGIVID